MRGVNNHTQQKHWNSKVPKRAHLSAALLSVTSLFLLGGVKQSHTDCQRFLLALHFRSALIPHITTYLRLAGVRLTHLTQMHTDTHLHAQASNLGQSTIKISTKSWAPPWRCKKKTIQTALECPEGRYTMVAWVRWSWAHTHTHILCMSIFLRTSLLYNKAADQNHHKISPWLYTKLNYTLKSHIFSLNDPFRLWGPSNKVLSV